MATVENILFVRVDDHIQQQALGNFLADNLNKIGRVFNVSSEDVVGGEGLPEKQYHYFPSEPIHRMPVQAKGDRAIDAELLDALSGDEHIILKMIERAHFRDPRYRYHDLRNHLYYMHLSHWLGFLADHEINHVVFGNVPHDGYDYIIYALAKYLGLKVDMFYQLQVVDSYVHAHRVEDLFTPIAHALSVLDEVTEDELSERMKVEYATRTQKQDPHYMKTKVRHGKVIDSVQRFLQNHVLRTERRRMIRDEIVLPANRYASEPDLTRRFIYFGLHVQPELTTNALGGRYVNQFLAIQLIARTLPDDVYLYVKEHPNMYKTRDPSGRFREFYEMIAGLTNVILVPVELDTFELIHRSIAVATITGTLGWEAVFEGKPVLVFGNSFYKFCHGVFAIESERDMQAALESIFSWEPSPERERKEILRYLKAVERSSEKGLINHSFIPVSLEKDEAVHADLFEKTLNRIVFS